jgi:hypothetical protein
MSDIGGAVEAPWLTLAEAAERTGRHIDALRTMARRGKLERRKGNSGQWLVRLPTDGLPRSDGGGDLAIDQGLAEVVAELREEVTELRVALAKSEAGHEAMLAQVKAEGEARAARAEAERDTAREALLAERERVVKLDRQLEELRRPWWRRLVGA